MRTNTYIGLFSDISGHEYTLSVNCNGGIQAFILLTADAIRGGRHYQLETITCKHDNISWEVKDIAFISNLLR